MLSWPAYRFPCFEYNSFKYDNVGTTHVSVGYSPTEEIRDINMYMYIYVYNATKVQYAINMIYNG